VFFRQNFSRARSARLRARDAPDHIADVIGDQNRAVGTERCQQETHAPQQIVKLFDYLVSAGEQRWRDSEAKGLGDIEVDDQLKLCRLLGWQIGRIRTL
jgi:hypothetical protein